MPGIPSKDASFVRETPRNYALTKDAASYDEFVALIKACEVEFLSEFSDMTINAKL